MRINNNLMAMNTHRQLGINANAGAKSIEKLSSGYRINRAGDDAAGLAISEKMRSQIRGLDQASRNAQDGISLIQTAEGALNETHDILQRMRELSVQASTDTNTDDDRVSLQNEINELKSEIDRISNTTEFNTMTLLDGSLSGSATGGQGTSLGDATSASIETTNIDPATFTGGSTQNFQVNLDGKTFELTGVTSTDTFAFFSDLETKLNTAIDAHNTANPTDTVEYAEFNIEVTNATSMNFTITSGTTGTSSEISITPLEDAVNTTAQAAGEIQDFLTDNTTATASSDGELTADNATAITGLNGNNLEMKFNGNDIDVALTTVDAATYNTGDNIQDVADDLETDINQALSDYKDLTGTDYGTVSVTVEDGKITIASSDPDTVSFEVVADENDVASTLGLDNVESGSEGGLEFQIGANENQTMNMTVGNMTVSGLDVADIDISTQDGAQAAITSLDNAIKSVSDQRAALGATQNRLEHTIKNLDTSAENLQASESRIRDVDMAKEMMEFTKNNILQQAAQSMLAQANQAPQGVLQLLR